MAHRRKPITKKREDQVSLTDITIKVTAGTKIGTLPKYQKIKSSERENKNHSERHIV